MQAGPRISVVIPTLDRPGTLQRAVHALALQTVGAQAFELVLAEDQRNREPPELPELPFAVRRVRGERPGASAARNAGWQAAATPLVLFLGDDIIAAPDLLAQHVSWHERNPGTEIGILGLVVWAREIRRSAFTTWLEHGVQFEYGTIRGAEATAAHFYTANVSLKRAALADAGGFDEERFPFLYEDIDLGTRLFERGFRLLFNRAARAEHLHQPRLDEWRERMRLVAQAERRRIELRPDNPPHFHDLFAYALTQPPSRGRWRPLLRWVPRRTPLIGERIWTSADLYYRQQLAGAFMESWRSST